MQTLVRPSPVSREPFARLRKERGKLSAGLSLLFSLVLILRGSQIIFKIEMTRNISEHWENARKEENNCCRFSDVPNSARSKTNPSVPPTERRTIFLFIYIFTPVIHNIINFQYYTYSNSQCETQWND